MPPFYYLFLQKCNIRCGLSFFVPGQFFSSIYQKIALFLFKIPYALLNSGKSCYEGQILIFVIGLTTWLYAVLSSPDWFFRCGLSFFVPGQFFSSIYQKIALFLFKIPYALLNSGKSCYGGQILIFLIGLTTWLYAVLSSHDWFFRCGLSFFVPGQFFSSIYQKIALPYQTN